MRLLRSFAGDRAGNVALLTAGGLTMLCGAAALGVDAGTLFLEKRRLQGVADAVALSAAADPGTAQAGATAALALQTGPAVVLSGVERGDYTLDSNRPADDRFVPSAAGAAVRVSVSSLAPTYFARAFGLVAPVPISARATAARVELAAFSIGSRVAAVNGGLPNALLSALAGSDLRLSVIDYNGLVGGQVDLLRLIDALRIELGLDGIDYADVLRTTPTLPQILRSASRASDDANLAATLSAMAGRVPATPISLDRLIDLGPLGSAVSVGNAPPIRIGALALVRVLLEAGGNRAVSADVAAGIPGLADARIRVAIGEPAAHSPWLAINAARTVTVRTSQARLALDVGLTAVAPGLGQIRVPLLIELAPAEATLTDVSCAGGRNNARVTLDVTPSAGTIALADYDAAAFPRFDQALTLRPATLARVPLASVSGIAELQLGRRTRPVSFNSAQIAAGTPRTVDTDDLVTALVRSLLQKVTLDATVLGLGLNASALTAVVGPILSAAAGPLDQLVDQVMAITGVRVGQADVWVNGVRCGTPILVG